MRAEEHPATQSQFAGFLLEEETAWLGMMDNKVTTDKEGQGKIRAVRDEENPVTLEQFRTMTGDELDIQTEGVTDRVSEEGRFYNESMELIKTEGNAVLGEQADYANQQVGIVRDAVGNLRSEVNNLESLRDRLRGEAAAARRDAAAAREDLASTATAADRSSGGGGGGYSAVGSGATFAFHEGGYIAPGTGPVMGIVHENEAVIPLDRWSDIMDMAADKMGSTSGMGRGVRDINVSIEIKESGTDIIGSIRSGKLSGEARWQMENIVRDAVQDALRRGDLPITN